MARPKKQTADYFPHDSRASDSDTLTVLQSRFGNDGYAFWFKLLEKLASTEGHLIDCNSPVKWQVLLAKMGVSELLGVEIMNILVEMKAIDPKLWQSKLIWCQNLVNNLADVYKNRRQELPQKPISTGNNAITTGKNAITTPNLPLETPQSKLKERKVKESKVDSGNTRRVFGEFQNVYLSLDEYDKLVKRLGQKCATDLIERLGGYMKSRRKKYDSHYATILNWSRDDAKSQGGADGDDKRHPAQGKPGAKRDIERGEYEQREPEGRGAPAYKPDPLQAFRDGGGTVILSGEDAEEGNEDRRV